MRPFFFGCTSNPRTKAFLLSGWRTSQPQRYFDLLSTKKLSGLRCSHPSCPHHHTRVIASCGRKYSKHRLRAA